jgi:hypothetical protein
MSGLVKLPVHWSRMRRIPLLLISSLAWIINLFVLRIGVLVVERADLWPHTWHLSALEREGVLQLVIHRIRMAKRSTLVFVQVSWVETFDVAEVE